MIDDVVMIHASGARVAVDATSPEGKLLRAIFPTRDPRPAAPWYGLGAIASGIDCVWWDAATNAGRAPNGTRCCPICRGPIAVHTEQQLRLELDACARELRGRHFDSLEDCVRAYCAHTGGDVEAAFRELRGRGAIE